MKNLTQTVIDSATPTQDPTIAEAAQALRAVRQKLLDHAARLDDVPFDTAERCYEATAAIRTALRVLETGYDHR